MWVGRHEERWGCDFSVGALRFRGSAAYAFGTTILLQACSASLAEGLASGKPRSPTEQHMSLAGVQA